MGNVMFRLPVGYSPCGGWLQRAPPPLSALNHEMEKKISTPTSTVAGSPIVLV